MSFFVIPLELVYCRFFMIKDCVDREFSRVFENVCWWGWVAWVRWVWGMNWGVGLSRKNVVICYDVVVL